MSVTADIYWKDEGDFAFVGPMSDAGEEALRDVLVKIDPEPPSPFIPEGESERPRWALDPDALGKLRCVLSDDLTIWET